MKNMLEQLSSRRPVAARAASAEPRSARPSTERLETNTAYQEHPAGGAPPAGRRRGATAPSASELEQNVELASEPPARPEPARLRVRAAEGRARREEDELRPVPRPPRAGAGRRTRWTRPASPTCRSSTTPPVPRKPARSRTRASRSPSGSWARWSSASVAPSASSRCTPRCTDARDGEMRLGVPVLAVVPEAGLNARSASGPVSTPCADARRRRTEATSGTTPGVAGLARRLQRRARRDPPLPLRDRRRGDDARVPRPRPHGDDRDVRDAARASCARCYTVISLDEHGRRDPHGPPLPAARRRDHLRRRLPSTTTRTPTRCCAPQGLPATFYVTTGTIDGGPALWTAKLRFMVRTTTRRRSCCPAPLGAPAPIDGPADRQALFTPLIVALKNVPSAAALRARRGARPTAFGDHRLLARSRGIMMTWAQLREMSQQRHDDRRAHRLAPEPPAHRGRGGDARDRRVARRDRRASRRARWRTSRTRTAAARRT